MTNDALVSRLRALIQKGDEASRVEDALSALNEIGSLLPDVFSRIAELEKAAAEAKAERFGIQCVNNYAVGLDGVARLIPSPHNTPDAPLTK